MLSQLQTSIEGDAQELGDLGNGLTSLVMPKLLRRLEVDGNFLTAEQQKGLRAIPATIEAMAKGGAGDKHLLSSLPPGMGKTTALAETVKAMLADPAYSNVGVLILINQLNLIVPLIKRMGFTLDDTRFAVYVGKRNKELNQLGAGIKNKNKAQVLITTQAKFVVSSGSKWNKDFESNKSYRYEGKRRQVVVWDEAASPGFPIAFTLKMIEDCADKVEAKRPTMARALRKWITDLKYVTSGLSTVPIWFLDATCRTGGPRRNGTLWRRR